jgi:hypothetical protein
MLLIAGRQVVGNEGDVDLGLSDEERLHSFPVGWWMVLARRVTLAPVVVDFRANYSQPCRVNRLRWGCGRNTTVTGYRGQAR